MGVIIKMYLLMSGLVL